MVTPQEVEEWGVQELEQTLGSMAMDKGTSAMWLLMFFHILISSLTFPVILSHDHL